MMRKNGETSDEDGEPAKVMFEGGTAVGAHFGTRYLKCYAVTSGVCFHSLCVRLLLNFGTGRQNAVLGSCCVCVLRYCLAEAATHGRLSAPS